MKARKQFDSAVFFRAAPYSIERDYNPPSARRHDFGRAANPRYDHYQTRFEHGSVALWNYIVDNEGRVDLYSAAQFIESHANGLFHRNPNITDSRTQKKLDHLGFETIVNLFGALSERPMQGMSLYLDALNRAMGLDDAYYRARTKNIQKFFEPANGAFLETKWEEARRQSRIAHSEKTFSDAMADAFNDPEMVTKGDFLRRKALLQFISDAYSDFVGEPRIEVKLISASPELGGYHGKDEKTGRNVIGININNFAFQKNFQTALNILMHERHHGSQQFLVDEYKAGKIGKTDANYIAARVAVANMGPYGYIQPDYIAGALAYRDQPIEVEANYAGKLAEYHAHTTYARAPNPIISVRDSHRDKAETKGYEALLDRYPGSSQPPRRNQPPGPRFDPS